MSSLFDQFESMRKQSIPCALQSGAEVVDPETGKTGHVMLPGSKPIHFEIHQVSSNEMIEADAVLLAAKPPELTHEEARGGTMGMVKVSDGYDLDDPGYLAERHRLMPRRNAMVCLFGCDALRESTPGNSLDEKADAIVNRMGAVIVQWMADKIENFMLFAGVGEREVAIFLASSSAEPASSKNSKTKSPRASSKRASKGRTEPASPTNSGNPPASGE